MEKTLIFGKYEVIRRIAVGGMGEIFLARQGGIDGFDRLAILKSLLPDMAQDKDQVAMFLDEARVAATLNHPNIVSIYEVGLWEGTYFIAMEYIHGESLARIMMAALENDQRVPIDVVLRIIRDVARGLHHAHTAKDAEGKPLEIVHRDISPQNIMVRADGVTRIVDFGIARASNRETRTATGLVKGKLQYMAPEQIEGKELDARSDEFALGVVFWELTTGRRLFAAENQLKTLEKLKAGVVPAVSEFRDDVPPSIERIIRRMLQRAADERYAACSLVADELDALMEALRDYPTEETVSEFVKGVVGESIEERTKDLTSDQANFVIPLSSGSQEARTTVDRRPRSLKPLAAAAIVLLAAGVGLVFAPRADEPVVAAVAPTPAPVVQELGTLELTSEPKGADVRKDGASLGLTPLTRRLSAVDGPVRLQVSKGGYVEETIEVQLVAGETTRRDVRLKRKRKERRRRAKAPAPAIAKAPKNLPPAAPARVEPGILRANTEPWSLVTANGERLGSTPLPNRKLAPGDYELVFEDENGRRRVKRVTIKSGETTKVFIDF